VLRTTVGYRVLRTTVGYRVLRTTVGYRVLRTTVGYCVHPAQPSATAVLVQHCLLAITHGLCSNRGPA
jgi:hypothetical protein